MELILFMLVLVLISILAPFFGTDTRTRELLRQR